MKEFKAAVQEAQGLQFVSRQEALFFAALRLRDAREKVAALYGWLLAGELENPVDPVLWAEDVLHSLLEAKQLAYLFADPLSGDVSGEALAFLEAARLEASKAGEEVR